MLDLGYWQLVGVTEDDEERREEWPIIDPDYISNHIYGQMWYFYRDKPHLNVNIKVRREDWKNFSWVNVDGEREWFPWKEEQEKLDRRKAERDSGQKISEERWRKMLDEQKRQKSVQKENKKVAETPSTKGKASKAVDKKAPVATKKTPVPAKIKKLVEVKKKTPDRAAKMKRPDRVSVGDKPFVVGAECAAGFCCQVKGKKMRKEDESTDDHATCVGCEKLCHIPCTDDAGKWKKSLLEHGIGITKIDCLCSQCISGGFVKDVHFGKTVVWKFGEEEEEITFGQECCAGKYCEFKFKRIVHRGGLCMCQKCKGVVHEQCSYKPEEVEEQLRAEGIEEIDFGQGVCSNCFESFPKNKEDKTKEEKSDPTVDEADLESTDDEEIDDDVPLSSLMNE